MCRWIWRGSVLTVLFLAASAQAATYYVRPGGDDSADGLSHDAAWATLEEVKRRSFEPGDHLLFLQGGRWEGQLIVNWPGTDDERTIVGAYYLQDGVPVRGFKSSRPVIDGTDSLPNQQYGGLVRVTKERVRIENLHVVNSEGRGIQFESADDGIVAGCVVENSYKSGIKFIDSVRAAVKNNTITRVGMAYPEEGKDWGGAIALVRSAKGIVRKNQISEVYGEAINLNENSADGLVEDNWIYAARAVGIYIDASPNVTVRRNLVVGTTNPEFWRNGSSTGPGIALNNERYHYESEGGPLPADVQATGVRIYANLVAYTQSGVAFWGQLDETSFDNVYVFNNTLVDNDTQLTLRGEPKHGSLLVNNILLSLSPGTADVDRNKVNGLTAKANYFSGGDPGGGLSHVNNRYEGIVLKRMTGWRSVSDASYVRWQDFEAADNSATIGTGQGLPLDMVQADDTFDLDFNSQVHNSPMDIGAVRFSVVQYRKPKRPTGVFSRP